MWNWGYKIGNRPSKYYIQYVREYEDQIQRHLKYKSSHWCTLNNKGIFFLFQNIMVWVNFLNFMVLFCYLNHAAICVDFICFVSNTLSRIWHSYNIECDPGNKKSSYSLCMWTKFQWLTSADMVIEFYLNELMMNLMAFSNSHRLLSVLKSDLYSS